MSPAPVFLRIPGSHHPGTRLRLVPGFRDPGSVLILGQVTQYGNPYLICITLDIVARDGTTVNMYLYGSFISESQGLYCEWYGKYWLCHTHVMAIHSTGHMSSLSSLGQYICIYIYMYGNLLRSLAQIAVDKESLAWFCMAMSYPWNEYQRYQWLSARLQYLYCC